MLDPGMLEMLGAAIVSAVGTIGAFYQVFVPRDEARAYRAGVADSITSLKEEAVAYRVGVANSVTNLKEDAVAYREVVANSIVNMKDEARAYREGVSESVSNIKESLKKADHRIDKVEVHISRVLTTMLTRENLNDIINPVKADLSEIKLILRERKREKGAIDE
jgi:archaellum component FlaC